MAKTRNLVSETLKKTFPHWTEKHISDLTAHIFATYGNLIKTKDDESAVLELLNIAIMAAIKTYPVYRVLPGLIRITLRQQQSKQHEKETERIDNENLDDSETFTDRMPIGPDFDLDKYREKIDQLENYVLRMCGLTPTEEKLFRTWMEVLKRETRPTGYPIFGARGVSIDLMDELLDEVRNSGWNITNGYFRKLLSDIKAKLGRQMTEIAGELMSFIQTEDADLKELKALLIEHIDFLFQTNTNIAAYRFSDEEIDKMKWLKKLFTDNGFSFDPYRFPEVYYDDYDKVKELYPELKADQQETPDYLGVYIFHLKSGAKNEACGKSKEGIIVLFRDRIENYRRIPTDDLRFAVLMHEIGHWLSHWTYRKGYNWSIGYHLPNEKTHEVFAQLFAYWACKDNPLHLEALMALTPKTPDLTINTEAIYGRYWELRDRSYTSILEKLHQIREGWMLKDDVMIDFLKKEGEDDIEKWLRSQEDFTQEKISNCKISSLHCGKDVSDRLLRLLIPDKRQVNNIIGSREYLL
jgi:hypothetical protein